MNDDKLYPLTSTTSDFGSVTLFRHETIPVTYEVHAYADFDVAYQNKDDGFDEFKVRGLTPLIDCQGSTYDPKAICNLKETTESFQEAWAIYCELQATYMRVQRNLTAYNLRKK